MTVQRALIFANGTLDDDQAVARLLHPGDLLVAADGGARHLARLGLCPNLLVGDLDSLSTAEVDALAQAGVEILRYSVDKDETDLELAIQAALDRGCTELVIVAALGARVDQTLGNIFLLGLPALRDVQVRLDDGRDELFLISERGSIHGRAGDVVSLLPLGGPARGIYTQGLRYPLNGETLYPERTRGISNVLMDEHAQVELSEGLLICVHTRTISD
jgi:thiamine pyrophosphokinase